ncbi:MAG TPA: hypothetical protein VK325_00535, partial [Pseudoxanthomonas sp.]|nr:hypothetical protein [Pseudoxanthomonas sp.]
ARPCWAVAATLVAVVAGALGSLGLLVRKKWALPVLALSLAGIVVQDIGLFVLTDGAALGGPAVLVMQALVLAVGAGLVLLGRKGAAKGWLT